MRTYKDDRSNRRRFLRFLAGSPLLAYAGMAATSPAGSEIAGVSHQFMLVSSLGTTSAATKLGVAKLGVWSDDQQSQNAACESGDCLHASTYSRPLLTALELQEQLGATGARTLIQAQPYLSPLGGLFLIVAHVMNIRLRCCRRAPCSKS